MRNGSVSGSRARERVERRGRGGLTRLCDRSPGRVGGKLGTGGARRLSSRVAGATTHLSHCRSSEGLISRAGSSFAAFPSFDVSAVSALAPGETGSVAPASPIVPCRGCELAKSELQPGVAYQDSSSRRSASASRPRDRRIARRVTLGDFTRVGTPRRPVSRARRRHGGENRIRWAPRAPLSVSALVDWSFTLENN